MITISNAYDLLGHICENFYQRTGNCGTLYVYDPETDLNEKCVESSIKHNTDTIRYQTELHNVF